MDEVTGPFHSYSQQA